MINEGVYTLGTKALGAALAAQEQTPIEELDGMGAVTITADFTYGSGTGTCRAVVRTKLGADGQAIEIARFDFTEATARKVCTLNANAAKAIAAIVALSAEGVFDGVLGNVLDVVILSTGTYVNSTLSVSAAVRG